MARHGPILKDNEAMGSGKVFKYLPGLRDTIKKSKIAAKVQKSKNTVFYRVLGGKIGGIHPVGCCRRLLLTLAVQGASAFLPCSCMGVACR